MTGRLGDLPLMQLILRAREERRGGPQAETGALDVDLVLRGVLAQALSECALSRWDVAARMGQLLSTDVSQARLDAWTAPSHAGHRFPAAYLPAFCQATGSTAPLELLADRAGLTIFASKEVLLAKRAQTSLRLRRLREEQRVIDKVLAALGEAGEGDR